MFTCSAPTSRICMLMTRVVTGGLLPSLAPLLPNPAKLALENCARQPRRRPTLLTLTSNDDGIVGTQLETELLYEKRKLFSRSPNTHILIHTGINYFSRKSERIACSGRAMAGLARASRFHLRYNSSNCYLGTHHNRPIACSNFKDNT